MDVQNPYEPPRSAEASPAEAPGDRVRFSPHYRRALGSALILQAFLGLLTALVLDGGRLHRLFWEAFLAQWALVGAVVWRRPRNPTPFGLILVRLGIVPMLALVAGLGWAAARIISASGL